MNHFEVVKAVNGIPAFRPAPIPAANNKTPPSVALVRTASLPPASAATADAPRHTGCIDISGRVRADSAASANRNFLKSVARKHARSKATVGLP
jgi:hypothetical protein